MKTKFLPILRCIVPAWLLLCIVLCRFFPVMAEGYARHIYPWLSAVLSATVSVFSFSLEEMLVVGIILWMIMYPFLKRRKKKSWRFIVGREVELLAWVYIWFYLGWGLNYFRYDIYRRMEVEPAGYDEQAFHRFLVSYTDSLNQSYTAEVKRILKGCGRRSRRFTGRFRLCMDWLFPGIISIRSRCGSIRFIRVWEYWDIWVLFLRSRN